MNVPLKTWAIASVLCLAIPTATVAAGLDLAAFTTLKQQCQPPENALWRTIPWKISLLDAQREAAVQKKPLFIWAMDGHPLGCT